METGWELGAAKAKLGHSHDQAHDQDHDHRNCELGKGWELGTGNHDPRTGWRRPRAAVLASGGT